MKSAKSCVWLLIITYVITLDDPLDNPLFTLESHFY